MSESLFGNHNSISREKYNNKSLEEVHSFDVVFSLEEIDLLRVSFLKKMAKKIKSVCYFFGTELPNI